MSETRYILAGNYQQARDFARDLPEGTHWRYIMDAQSVLGLHGITYTIVGTFWERRDAVEIYDTLRSRSATPTEEPT